VFILVYLIEVILYVQSASSFAMTVFIIIIIIVLTVVSS